MKGKKVKKSPKTPEAHTLSEVAAGEYFAAIQINVRAAKDRLSNLLELAARGEDIVITTDGKPKAKLVAWKAKRKPFRVDWELLRSTKPWAGPRAEEIIREERDGRP